MTEVSEKQKKRLAIATTWIKSTADKSDDKILEKAHQARDAFLAELDGLSDAQLDFSPGEGEWSVREVCRHVAQAVPQVNKAVGLLAGGTPLPDVDPGVISQMIDDPGEFEALKNEVAAALEACTDSVSVLAGDPDLSLRSAHPFFGPLNCREWVAFNIMHANVHVRQVQRVKGSPGYPA